MAARCDGSGSYVIRTPDGPDSVACPGCDRCMDEIYRQDARDSM